MTVLLADRLRRGPDDVAVVDDTGTLTWRELAGRVDRWAAGLAAAGLGVGDTVAVLAGNRREVVEVVLAALHSGLTVVPVNQHLTATEVAHVLADSGALGLVADRPRASVAAEAVARAGVPLKVNAAVDAPPPGAGGPPEPVCGQLMVYTSGTTGAPKGVLNGLFRTGDPFDRSRRMFDYAGVALGVPDEGRVLLVGPWYHSAQLFFALISLLRGATLVVRARFDAADTLDTLRRERITHTHLVPTQLVRLLRLPDARRAAFDPSGLRRVWHGGAPCPVDVKRAMIDWWGPVLVEYYGASEAGAVTLVDSADWLARPGTVGRALRPHELLVVDGDGAPVPAGVPGHVYVRRPGRGFRYHRADDKTRAAHLRPGVFTFGELGYLDDDGYLFLTGRAQDMIVSGGVNVYPAEVEAVLLRHPAVRDAAVVGVPDDEFGERVAAVVELDAAAGDGLWAELDRHCRADLAGFKVPRRYRAVAAIPREPTGKVRKDRLRELMGP